MKRILTIIGGTFLVLIVFSIISIFLSAIPGKTKRVDSKPLTGKLNAITTCCPGGDITFHMDNDGGKSYYINRGVESGLNVEQLQKELIGKTITVYYYRYGWNVINFRNQVQHICELRTKDKVYYTELID